MDSFQWSINILWTHGKSLAFYSLRRQIGQDPYFSPVSEAGRVPCWPKAKASFLPSRIQVPHGRSPTVIWKTRWKIWEILKLLTSCGLGILLGKTLRNMKTYISRLITLVVEGRKLNLLTTQTLGIWRVTLLPSHPLHTYNGISNSYKNNIICMLTREKSLCYFAEKFWWQDYVLERACLQTTESGNVCVDQETEARLGFYFCNFWQQRQKGKHTSSSLKSLYYLLIWMSLPIKTCIKMQQWATSCASLAPKEALDGKKMPPWFMIFS